MKNKINIKKGDIITIAAAVLIAVAPSLLLFPGNSPPIVAITVGGSEIYRAPLSQNAEIQAGERNVVFISGGVVTMLHSDCPDGLCLSMRAKNAGESVVCLPNRVSAQVIVENGALDAISY